MNTTIHCQFAAPVKFRCAIQHHNPRQTGGIAPVWKPFLRRNWPVTGQTGRHNHIWLEPAAPHQKSTKINS